jgi:hypothetical protein
MKKAFALLSLLGVLAMMALVSVTAQDDAELQPDEEATFGTVPMVSGFVPDPWIETVLAGGPINAAAAELGEGCLGNIAAVPDVNIEWLEPSTSPIRIFVVSDDDTTLVIRDPEGNFLCNDDSGFPEARPLDPVIQIDEPIVGTYNIWVGTYLEEELADGYLMITEFADTFPGQIVSGLFGQIVTPE